MESDPNETLTLAAASVGSTQGGADPTQAPLQPLKTWPESGCARSVTIALLGERPEHGATRTPAKGLLSIDPGADDAVSEPETA